VIVVDDLPRPVPGEGNVSVRVANAGVGHWDALIRENKSVVNTPLPLIVGSDLSGVVEAVGPGVTQFQTGDEIYGATNPQFIGAYAEVALASAGMIARKPPSLSFSEAASAPVVAGSPQVRPIFPNVEGATRPAWLPAGRPVSSAGNSLRRRITMAEVDVRSCVCFRMEEG